MNIEKRIEALEKAVAELKSLEQPTEKPTAGYVEIEDESEMKAFLKRLDGTGITWLGGVKPSDLSPYVNTVGFDTVNDGLTHGWDPELGKLMTIEEFIQFLADNGYPEKPWEPTPNDGHLYAFWENTGLSVFRSLSSIDTESIWPYNDDHGTGWKHCAQIPHGTTVEELIDLTPEEIKEKGWNWV